MYVGQVIELAKEWVETYGNRTPGFCGAHLMGSLNYTPHDAPFSASSDVDLNIVLQGAQMSGPQDILYKGLILEYGSLSLERYSSPELVLADPELAANLAVNSILSDPIGILTSLHTTVAKEYPRRKWVLARCGAEKQRTGQGLDGLQHARSPVEAVSSLGAFFSVGLTGLIAIANLIPPTHRRCLVLMKGLLEQHGRADLHEDVLKLLGFAHLHTVQVQAYLHDCAEAFDCAVRVTRTPVPFGFKLHPHVRPYFIEGTQEMIVAGYPREAMYWILASLMIANGAIQVDASEEEKRYFQAKINQLLSDIGWGTLEDAALRLEWAKILANDVFQVADDMVSRNARITA
ncbi:MAG TPA: hypothetical protein VFR47_23220 [Anaerolineales bacterium]|nr:hypothetical protein [Anaerolineales bacterium]